MEKYGLKILTRHLAEHHLGEHRNDILPHKSALLYEKKRGHCLPADDLEQATHLLPAN